MGSVKCSKGSQPSEGSDGGYNSISPCMTLLSEISPRLEGPQWYRAIKEFCEPNMRQCFLLLDPVGREFGPRIVDEHA